MINEINDDLNKLLEILKIITEQSLVGIIIIQDGKLIYFNKRVSETSGYSIEEIKGWNPNDFLKVIHPEDRESVAEQARKRQLADPEVIDKNKFRIIRKNGEIAWIRVSTKRINYEGRTANLVMINDITDKIKSEQKLKGSEEKFRNIADHSLVAISVLQDGVYKYFNDKLVEINGYSAEEIRNWAPNEFAKIIHPEDREFVMEQARKKQTGDSDVINQYQFRIKRKDGEIRWIEIFSKTINYEGQPADLIMTNDITDKKKIEQKLKESEEKFRNIAEQSLMGISVTQDGVFKYFNDRVIESLGYSVEEIESWGPNEFAKFIYPEDREFVMEQAQKKQAGDPDVVNQYQYRIITKDGVIKWLEIFAKTINYDGHTADLAMTVDITDKIEAEQKLKESEEKFSKAFNSNALAMSISTMDEGIIIEVNDAFLKLFGFSRKEITGKTASEARLKGREERKEMLRTIEEQGSIINHETDYKTKSGEVRYGLFSFVKILLNDKPFLLTIINDITPLKIAEQKLKQSKEKYLRAYNQVEFYKDLFIHDITNNLQSLYSSIQLIDINLDENCKNNTIKDFINIIYRQINRGTELVANVRKLSQLEAEEVFIDEIDVFEVLNRSIEFLKNLFQDKKIQIKWDISSEKVLILGNNLLQDVFENILINSVRYNNNDIAEIIIKASQVEQNGISYWKLEFIDNGIGIENERKESVLSRADLDSKTTYGMGLGLSLVKKIIENYGGKVWIEDKVEGDYSKGTNVILLMQKGDH